MANKENKNKPTQQTFVPSCKRRQEIIDAIQKIRKEQGTLSGMSMELILEKAEGFLKPGKKKIPGLVYEKKKPNTLPPRMQQQQLQQQQQHISQKQQATKQPVSLLELKLPPRKSASIGFLKMDIPPRMKYNGALDTCLNTYEEDMCVICHDPLSSEVVKELDCKHVFHAQCIGQWVEKERTCPTCRQHALFPEEFPRLGK
ncbi:E3 ubiquitin-protein ligase DZIP3-like [Ruditapes philippinarum]|uniref:E3 ubiquitin-protein ligase DZIP3-like n=1 Tax=Ruditapes philippinarum TaxID=129788 RepID=UPI00295BEC2E|nr:E3 ubiquitin-protein ligase DZIP3-like [Ruditapes philippinarum]